MKKKELTFETIKKILDNFAEKGILFSNERQFQLEFASELKKMFDNVYLELLDYSENGKNYVDIVVDVGNNKYVAIELKYTTRDMNLLYKTTNREVYTFKQGAGDIRRFDYLKDVERLEKLEKRNNSSVFGIVGAKVIKGFAIIMTNDNYHKLNGKKRKNNQIMDTQYVQVALQENRKISVNEQPLRITTSGYADKEINLKYDYTCHWYDYNLDQHKTKIQLKNKELEIPYSTYPFRYMILEINP